MDHHPHVGFVDTHSEGVGGHHHTRLSRDPAVLSFLFVIGGEACMVCRGGYPGGIEVLGDIGSTFAASYVDDGTARGAAEDVEHVMDFGIRPAHYIVEIGAREAHAPPAGIIHPELRADVIGHFRSGGGGEGEQRYSGQYVAQSAYVEVGWPEIIAPLRDAVSLVDYYQLHLYAPEVVEKRLVAEPFGRHVEEAGVAVHQMLARHVAFPRCHS